MRARTVDKRDGFDPAFIDIFEQVLEVYGFPNVEDLSGRKQKGGERSRISPASFLFRTLW